MRYRPTRLLPLLLAALLLPSAPAQGQEDPASERTPVTVQAEAAARLFREDPERGAPEGRYETLFTSSFLNQVPASQLSGISRQYFSQYGRVTEVQPRQVQSDTQGTFYFIFEKGYRVPATLIVQAAPPHRISGFRIGMAEPVEQAESLAEVTRQLAARPGEVSFLLAEIGAGGDLKTRAAHRPEAPAAIGSAFKLYVLGALVRAIEAGERDWDDVARLEEDAKSLPSGFLQTWPEGAPLTLHTLATLMISRSDNTATDALLHVLGRRAVESAQEAMGHAQPALNAPFLTTRELFVLKADTALAERFLAADEAERRALLAGEVAAVPRTDIATFSEPTRIAELEWFASAQDLARAMAWFQQESAVRQQAREVLAVNPGLDFDGARWSYIGFKGGSEPGVINTTFLLQDAGGTWYALAASQNNPDAAVDQTSFFNLVKQAARLASRSDADAAGDAR